MSLLFRCAIYISLMVAPAFALDWTQPILDESGVQITDGTLCAGKDKCEQVLTIQRLAARALCMPDQTITDPLKKAESCALGLKIMANPNLSPSPEELAIAKAAIGRLPSPLAVARGWEILDKAVK